MVSTYNVAYLLAYGSNQYGELCVSALNARQKSVKKILDGNNRSVKQVEVANKVTLVLYDNGQLVASGCNLYGAMQLKYNSVENVEVELSVLSNEKVTQICSLLDVDIDL